MARAILRGCRRRSFIHHVIPVGTLLASVILIGVPAANAQVDAPSLNTCFNTSGIPCYARGSFHDGNAKGGGFVETKVTGTSASGSSWLNQTLWVTTNGNTESDWGEIGYTDNNPLCRGKRSWYYTYVNPSSQVQACTSGSVTKGDWYDLEVQQTTSNAYGIYLNNALVATDSGASGSSYYDYAGSEYHLDTVNTNGDAYFEYNEVRNVACCTWAYWPSGGSNVSYSSDINWHWKTDWTYGYDSGSD